MHPGLSVILFTTTTGAGYGMLVLLGVLGFAGLVPADFWFGFVAFGVALGAITFGLLSSTFHLGHPERAWRAFSQWRSSWLSREGVLAVVTYGPAGLFALGWVFLGDNGNVLGPVTAVLAAVTVFCTAMIYRSLATIHQWCNAWVVPNYLALGLMTGAVWLNLLLAAFGLADSNFALFTAAVVAVAAALKLAYWNFIDTTAHPSTPESATGLGGLGKVRLFEGPHTEENYLMKEMGYRIARKHGRKLRRIAVTTTFAAPLVLTLIAAVIPPGLLLIACAGLAAISVSIGVLIERWLFFAEAKHVVILYYGGERA
jgi:DMSO reductase anchor subunit